MDEDGSVGEDEEGDLKLGSESAPPSTLDSGLFAVPPTAETVPGPLDDFWSLLDNFWSLLNDFWSLPGVFPSTGVEVAVVFVATDAEEATLALLEKEE